MIKICENIAQKKKKKICENKSPRKFTTRLVMGLMARRVCYSQSCTMSF